MFLLGGCCATAPADPHDTLRHDLDAAIERAANYLESKQDQRGAWPSTTYGLLRDGVSLSPHVLRALVDANRDNPSTTQGFAFITEQFNWTRSLPSRASFGPAVTGPVYFCADTSIAAAIAPGGGHPKLRSLYTMLSVHQVRVDDAEPFAQQGGWGYGTGPLSAIPFNATLIERFEHGRSPTPILPNQSANISATVYALDALACFPPITAYPPTQRDDTHPRILNEAQRFAARCQNFDTGDKRFDDGGFFFNPVDPARNKGGPAGTDANGYARFHSAGSSTADGLRVLLRCGLDRNDPRVAAARDWLFKHFDPEHHPGTFNDDRAVLRDAYYFYYAASVADTFTLLGEGPNDWQADLAQALIRRQQADGSFANPYTDGKEDDPLVATPFALRAMAACRRAIDR